MVRGHQKQCSQVSDVQIHKYNYTTTQIHKYTSKMQGRAVIKALWQYSHSLMCKYTNTQIQLHKYTNTVWVKFADRPNMCYIFEKVMDGGPQKQDHLRWRYSTVNNLEKFE